MKKIFFWLSCILVVSFVVRFWQLSHYPLSLSMDEVGFGYNANSILKTGQDEFGQRFPLVFKNLGDYKLPVDVYLTAISISIFGENELGIRFPVAFFGALTPILFVVLLKRLNFSWSASIAAGFWVSLLGWHVFMSRASFEAVIALFLLIMATYYFVTWANSHNSNHFFLSIFSFCLSVFTYNAARFFVPFYFLSLMIIYSRSFKEVFKRPRKYIFSFITILIFVFPLLYLLFSGNSVTSRASDLWIGKDNSTWITQYLNYFDPVFWFWKGIKITPPNYPDVGLIYLIDMPIFLLGVYGLSKSRNIILKKLILVWLLLAPIPASLTRGDASPVRFLIFLPFFVFVMASGFEKIFMLKRRVIFVCIYTFLFLFNFMYFSDLYVNNFYKFYGDLWHFGYKEVAQYACQNHTKYDKIIITDKYGIEWPSVKAVPYLYVLVYCGWNPASYLSDKHLYNIEFRQPQWRIDSKEKNWLLIGSRWDFPENFDKNRIMKTIYFPFSTHEPKAAFYFVETNESFVETDK